jgi:hypothetical protein
MLTNYGVYMCIRDKRDAHGETIATDFIHNLHFVTDPVLAAEVMKVKIT